MIARQRAFRFGVISHNTSPSLPMLIERARQAEQLGYATFLLPDHLEDQFAPALALAMVAFATTTLRVGSLVFDNDFRHPALLAKEAATLDILSNGRFELGLGAGWMQSEYEQIGLTFDRASVRIERLAEALHIIKSLLTEEATSFAGKHYRVSGLHGLPRSVQRPHPPIHVGGSGRRMLTLAAQEATSVGFIPKLRSAVRGEHMNALLDIEDVSPEATMMKVQWVREAAGSRFADLELNIVLMEAQVTEQRDLAVQDLAARYGISEAQVMATPFLLAGSAEQISEELWAARERYGISYIVIWEDYMEQFAPVVAQLTGR